MFTPRHETEKQRKARIAKLADVYRANKRGKDYEQGRQGRAGFYDAGSTWITGIDRKGR